MVIKSGFYPCSKKCHGNFGKSLPASEIWFWSSIKLKRLDEIFKFPFSSNSMILYISPCQNKQIHKQELGPCLLLLCSFVAPYLEQSSCSANFYWSTDWISQYHRKDTRDSCLAAIDYSSPPAKAHRLPHTSLPEALVFSSHSSWSPLTPLTFHIVPIPIHFSWAQYWRKLSTDSIVFPFITLLPDFI